MLVAFISKHKMVGWQLGGDTGTIVEEACKYPHLDFTVIMARSHGKEMEGQACVFIYYSYL